MASLGTLKGKEGENENEADPRQKRKYVSLWLLSKLKHYIYSSQQHLDNVLMQFFCTAECGKVGVMDWFPRMLLIYIYLKSV